MDAIGDDLLIGVAIFEGLVQTMKLINFADVLEPKNQRQTTYLYQPVLGLCGGFTPGPAPKRKPRHIIGFFFFFIVLMIPSIVLFN